MLVIAQMVVVRDEGADLDFEIVREEVVLQQDAVLERLMPALDLSLGHRMMRRTTVCSMVGRQAIWPGHRRGNSLHRRATTDLSDRRQRLSGPIFSIVCTENLNPDVEAMKSAKDRI